MAHLLKGLPVCFQLAFDDHYSLVEDIMFRDMMMRHEAEELAEEEVRLCEAKSKFKQEQEAES